MYYVYFLKSENFDQIYDGWTSDFRRRLKQHNNGENKSTKRYLPWKLVYYEAFLSKKDAMVRELKLKNHGKGIYDLKRRLVNSLDGIGEG